MPAWDCRLTTSIIKSLNNHRVFRLARGTFYCMYSLQRGGGEADPAWPGGGAAGWVIISKSWALLSVLFISSHSQPSLLHSTTYLPVAHQTLPLSPRQTSSLHPTDPVIRPELHYFSPHTRPGGRRNLIEWWLQGQEYVEFVSQSVLVETDTFIYFLPGGRWTLCKCVNNLNVKHFTGRKNFISR